MSNLIKQQLCVRGEKDSIETFKNSFISLDEPCESFDFDRLFGEYEYVVSRAYLEENHPDEEFDNILISEEHSPNFDLHYKSRDNYYEFLKKNSYTPCSELDPKNPFYDIISTSDNQIILRFTSRSSPVLPALIETSKQYPDLYFRLAFIDCSEPNHPDFSGCIEGQNGIFKDSKHDCGFYHDESKRPIFQYSYGKWIYCDTIEYNDDPMFSPEKRDSEYFDTVSNRVVFEFKERWAYADSIEEVEGLYFFPGVTNRLFL